MLGAVLVLVHNRLLSCAAADRGRGTKIETTTTTTILIFIWHSKYTLQLNLYMYIHSTVKLNKLMKSSHEFYRIHSNELERFGAMLKELQSSV